MSDLPSLEAIEAARRAKARNAWTGGVASGYDSEAAWESALKAAYSIDLAPLQQQLAEAQQRIATLEAENKKLERASVLCEDSPCENASEDEPVRWWVCNEHYTKIQLERNRLKAENQRLTLALRKLEKHPEECIEDGKCVSQLALEKVQTQIEDLRECLISARCILYEGATCKEKFKFHLENVLSRTDPVNQ